MGRAYGNIGNAYSAAGFYDSAIKYHKQELTISKVRVLMLSQLWIGYRDICLGSA